MQTEIYYFSGTGNSLHVAKVLQNRLPDTSIIPMVSLLDQDAIITRGDSVGFVFPIYVSTIPVPVKRFLSRVDPASAQYIFAVATQGTSMRSLADICLERYLNKHGRSLDSFFTLYMASNSPTGIMPPFISSIRDWADGISPEKIAQLEAEVQAGLDKIQGIVTSRGHYPERGVPQRLRGFLEYGMSLLGPGERTNTKIGFYSDSSCSSCGTCKRVCPSGKIQMVGGKPVWQDNVHCHTCYACFNYCPMQSILIRNFRNSYLAKNGRYHHPAITADDIAGQKP